MPEFYDPIEEARRALDLYRKCDYADRWVYKEVLVSLHVQRLLLEAESLRSRFDELSAEVNRLSRIAQY